MVSRGGDEVFGRDAERAVGAAFLDAVGSGPAGLVLSGPAGIGKSTIWRLILADAAGRGYRPLATRAVEAEAQLAFSALADLLAPGLDEVIDRLPPAQRIALGVALQREPAKGAEPAPLAVSLGALSAVRVLAEASPVIVAVDDLPWLDGPSARVLEYTVRRLGGARVGLLATIRSDAADPVLPPTAASFEGPVDRLHVGPLDLDAVDTLVRAELGLSLLRPTLAWVHAASRGNPFHALEIARVIQRTGLRPGIEGLAISTETSTLVRGRLDALPPPTRIALAAAAALGRPSVGLVAAVAPDAAGALAAARDAGIVELDEDRVRFTHPLLAAGAYSLLGDDERRRLHGRLAEASPDPEQRARHLALATDGPSDVVAAALDRAAFDARARGGSDAAAELALAAARRTPPDDRAALGRRIVAAGGYFIQAGDPIRAREVLEEHVATAAPGPPRAEALRVLADARSSDDWRAKARLLDQALAEAGEDHRLRGQILQAIAQADWDQARDAPGQVAVAMAAVAEAEAQDDPVARCSAYLTAVLAHLNSGGGLATDLLEKATALAPLVETQRVYTWPAFCRALTDIQCDRFDAAIVALEGLRARAVELGDWDSLPLIANNLAIACFRRGRWDETLRHSLDGERASRQNGQAHGLAWVLGTRTLVEACLGNEEAARRAGREGVELAMQTGSLAVELDNRFGLGFLALSAGDNAGAASELEKAFRPWLEAGYRDPGQIWALPDWAVALVGLDRAAEAVDALDVFEDAARRLDRASALAAALRVRGMIAAAAGDEAAAEGAFAGALAQHDRALEPFQRARTLLAHGEALRRFRRRGRAREALAEAVAVFEGLGAHPWRERAAAELARTGHREAGDAFTPTERQVAELVAAGRTNREVAETLFMSPHTVEAHLTRIYRSLGVRGRTELARALASRSAAADDGAATDRGHG